MDLASSFTEHRHAFFLHSNGGEGFESWLGTGDQGSAQTDSGFCFVLIPYAPVSDDTPYAYTAWHPSALVRANGPLPDAIGQPTGTIAMKPLLGKAAYIEKINALKQHIQQGDIYEINFCMEFSAENVRIDPVQTYLRLNAISEAPFSALVRHNDLYLICSSPERFLKKEGSHLITQPIKGTARRGHTPEEDGRLKDNLRHSLKEQTENVMIVDVARNDLSKIAQKKTVKVDELFGVRSYKQVHHLVSTVSCELKEGTAFEAILQAAFPMASMTGAPKQRATDLIAHYEPSPRGYYSGCIGYKDTDGNFDLNVVIRTIVYDAAKQKVSFHVGSAITALCDAEAEYDECLVKAGAMLKALNAMIIED